MRKAQRTSISEAVKAREEAFEKGSYRRVIDSILGKRREYCRIAEVMKEDGTVETEPRAVAEALADHFQDAFAGGGTRPWFKQAGILPPTVKEFFADSVKGRQAREQALLGTYDTTSGTPYRNHGSGWYQRWCEANLPRQDKRQTHVLATC